METRYPIRKADGKDFAGPDEILALLRNERHGQWLAGNNGMWHGGIHISRESAPLAVISAESAEGAVPLQCIAQGEIVAWRLQQDYHQQPYGEAAEDEEAINLKYSSAFVLVRSVHKPDENPATWLTFYTLYMHLAPLSCFPKMMVYEVTREGDGLSKRRYSGTETSGQEAPPSFGALSAGQKVIVEQEMMFLVPQRHRGRDGQRLPDAPFQFGLARNIKDGAPSGEKFWTSVMPRFVAPAGEKYAYLPDWMDKAVQNGTMDAVVVPPQPIAIRAGDAIGFLAQDDAPVTGGAVQSDWFMHIEVLSNDANMPAFLSNPGHLTKGTLYIEVQARQPLYRCEEKDGKKIFMPLENTSDAEAGKLLRRDDAKPWKDEAGISWYLIKPETWIKQDGIKEIIQHDLKALRFTPLEQEPAKDFQQSLGEQWLSKAFNFISGAVHPERALESQELSEYYSQIAKVLDANGDGKISATELKLYRTAVLQGLRHNNEEVEMLLRRLIVKHESEWYGKSSHPRWQTLLGSLPKAGQDYAKIWIDNHEWMSQVPALAKDEALWHFHPVEFLDTLNVKGLCACNRDISLDEIKKITVGVNTNILTNYLEELNEGFRRFEITTCRAKAHFLAQILHESGNLQYTKEINGENAFYQPWYGRGLIQITLEANYISYGKYINEDVISSNSARDKLTILPHSVLSAFWFFKIHKSLNIPSNNDDFNKITAIINGGFNGYEERLKIFDKAVKALSAEHLNMKQQNQIFDFQSSDISSNKIYSFGWGLWHDPATKKTGVLKNKHQALEGYVRAKELIIANPFPRSQSRRKIYGIEYQNVLNYINDRISKLEVN